MTLHHQADLHPLSLQTNTAEWQEASAQMLLILSVEMFLALIILETKFPDQVLNVVWAYGFEFAVFPLAFSDRSHRAKLNA